MISRPHIAVGTVLQRFDYYPFGKVSYAWTDGTNVDYAHRWRFGGKEIAGQKMGASAPAGIAAAAAGSPYLDFGARLYDPRTAAWLSQDPLAEKYYSISPYAYCAGNPVNLVDPDGELFDDYYSLINGKYLGSDAFGSSARLIDPVLYEKITGGELLIKTLPTTETLRTNSTVISFDIDKIESDAQKVADLSRESRIEHQSVLVLNTKTATVTSVDGPPGTNGHAMLQYYPAPLTGVNYYDRPGGLIIIGEIHGHPATNLPGMVTERTMSDNFDVPMAIKMQIPVYGVDAMYGRKGSQVSVHMVTPTGEIKNNIRKTMGKKNINNYSNWGLDALKLWGKSSYPQ